MAEAVGLAASIIAVVQLSGAIIKICKGYIEGVEGYPTELRSITIEISTLKAIFENLEFLSGCDKTTSPLLNQLDGEDGPVKGCYRVLASLLELFPNSSQAQITQSGNNPSALPASPIRKKRRVFTETLDRLAWPLKAGRARQLTSQLAQYKLTITVTLSLETK